MGNITSILNIIYSPLLSYKYIYVNSFLIIPIYMNVLNSFLYLYPQNIPQNYAIKWQKMGVFIYILNTLYIDNGR
jgi:hypothetical protein